MLSFLDRTPVGQPHAPCELTDFFGRALRIVLLSQNARGAICAHSLTSELADSLRLMIENMLNATKRLAMNCRRRHDLKQSFMNCPSDMNCATAH